MMTRAVVNAVIAFGSVFYVIYVAGEGGYGIYAGALGIFNFTDLVLKSEIRLHLLRYSSDQNKSQFDSAFTVLLLFSISVEIFVLITLCLLSPFPELIESYRPAFLILFALLPITVTSEVPRSIIESRSQFKKIAIDEFVSNLVQYIVVISWTFYIGDWKGLLYGWVGYQLVLTFYTWYRSKYIPALKYNKAEWKLLINHSYELSSQNLVKYFQYLINPLIVGYYSGTGGVGIISFAEKIVQGLSFFRNILYRISASIIAKLDPNKKEFSRFIERGVFLQILPLAILLLSASVFIYLISIWSNEPLWVWVNLLYPFLAVGYFFSTIFTIPILSLQMNNRNREVLRFLMFKTLLVIIFSLVLVKQIGILGYGIAEFLSILVFYFIYRKLSSTKLEVFNSNTQVLMICIPIALMWPYVGWLSSISFLIVPLLPKLITDYKQLFQSIRNS